MEAVPVYEAALRLILKAVSAPAAYSRDDIQELAATVRRALEIGGVKP
jgi:hypothetical protein